MSDFNDRIIAEFRANGGVVERFGSSLVLVHNIGAKSGEERVSPVMSIERADGSWLIAASKAGAPTNPGWYYNLKKTPDVTIETGTEEVEVTATELTGDDHAAAWTEFIGRAPGFADYQVKAGDRTIPVIRLSRRG